MESEKLKLNLGTLYKEINRINDALHMQHGKNEEVSSSSQNSSEDINSGESKWHTAPNSVRGQRNSRRKQKSKAKPKRSNSAPKRKSRRKWEIPELPKLTYHNVHTSTRNAIDDVTIYKADRDSRNDVIFREESLVLPPIENTVRFAEIPPDPQDVKEKQLVMRDFFRTGKLRRFANDRAVVPSVYKDFFESPKRKKSYINKMYIQDHVRKDNLSMECIRTRFSQSDSCQYCDVMGNKYCAFCIEFKNRHFAWGFENSFIPVLPHDHQATDSQLLTALVNKPTTQFFMDRPSRRNKRQVHI